MPLSTRRQGQIPPRPDASLSATLRLSSRERAREQTRAKRLSRTSIRDQELYYSPSGRKRSGGRQQASLCEKLFARTTICDQALSADSSSASGQGRSDRVRAADLAACKRRNELSSSDTTEALEEEGKREEEREKRKNSTAGKRQRFHAKRLSCGRHTAEGEIRRRFTVDPTRRETSLAVSVVGCEAIVFTSCLNTKKKNARHS